MEYLIEVRDANYFKDMPAIYEALESYYNEVEDLFDRVESAARISIVLRCNKVKLPVIIYVLTNIADFHSIDIVKVN